MRPPREVPGPDKRNAELVVWLYTRLNINAALGLKRNCTVRISVLVLQEYRKTSRCRIENSGVSLWALVQWKTMGHQRIEFDIAGRNQPEKLLHIAVLGPTNVRVRIISALLLVSRVIASGPISTRHEKLDFLQVHVVPWERHFHGPYHDNATAIAADIERQLTRSRRLGCRRDNHAIDTFAVRRSRHLLHKRASTFNGHLCA